MTSQPLASPTPGSDKGGDDAGNGKNPLNKVTDAASDLWGWITGVIGDAWDKVKSGTDSGHSEQSGTKE